jgi:2-keto-4-pentenoate hydratase/2-oxohepta-3-ene-1,7-dioic acid hydratase in catechol pathway
MRIIRFVANEGRTVVWGRATDPGLSAAHRIRLRGATLFDGFDVTDEVLRVERLLAPLVPVDILCIGLNYRDHAAETGATVPPNPMLFIKASNTLNDPGAPIPLPRLSEKVDYEAELAVVVGRTAKDVSAADAMAHVFGYTCGNDVSARDWQKDRDLGGGQFARGKSFDGFCPLGPSLVTADEVPDPQALTVRTTVNGRVMQDGTTADMIYPVAKLIESLSSTMTLRPGQVILTGTPAGVADGRTPPPFLRDGDVVVVEIEHVGRLENPVRRAGR